MINYIPIELKGFDEKGLDGFKGKKILSLRFPKKQSPKSGIWYLEIYWEGGETWRVNSNFTDTDSNFDVASIFVEKTMQSLDDISCEIKTLSLVDFVLKECRIAADYTDETDVSDSAIALISENYQELLIVKAPATGAVTFFFYQWFCGDDYPCVGCHLSGLRWRKSSA